MAKRAHESWDEVPENLKNAVGKYVTNIDTDTFAIVGFPPELTGGLLARYSRAPTGLRLTLVNEFLDEQGNPSQKKGSALMDRVLNAFGDDSVGELEGAHVGIEEVTQLLTKEIEDRRIGGSPIEQSTRYVRYDQKDAQGNWRYLRPQEVKDAGLLEKFEKVNDRAFEVYREGVGKLIEYFKKQFPREKFKIEVQRNDEKIKVGEQELAHEEEQKAFRNAYNFTVRCAALDVGRCVLPSSTLTHLGIFGNGRFYTNLITHLKSSALPEAHERGYALETELQKVIPTFIKRNREDPQRQEIPQNMKNIAKNLLGSLKPHADFVTLVPRADYLDELVSSALFPYTHISLPQIMHEMQSLPLEKKKEILETYRGERTTRRDRTGRGMEAGYPLVFDLVGGFAEYRDLERHRILTQQRQSLTPDLGFIMPPEMREMGLEEEVINVADRMADLYSDLRHAGVEESAQYATLFNHRMRFMLGMNLREFQHLSELRTQPAGHFSYRRMVMEMAHQVKEKYPFAETFLGFVDYSDPDNKISRAKEQSKIAGKNISSGTDASSDLM